MNAALALDEYPSRPFRAPHPSPANDADRREPSTAVRRQPSLYLVSCNPNHRSTTNTYAGQGCPNVAGARRAGAAGNVTEHQKTELGIAYSTKYSYDTADRILTITYPDNRVVSYTRDILGRITQATHTHNGSTTVLTQNRSYRADGLLSTQTFGNGLTESRTHDQQGRLTTWTLGTTTRTYTFDANSNLTQESGAQNRSFTYDTEDRLLAESGLHTQAYGYDLNGNRTQDLKADGTPRTYAYSPNSNRLTTLGAQAHTLDPIGNTLSDKNGRRVFTYDAAGRLTTVTVDGVLKGTYTYNHQHQRTRKVMATANGTARLVFHHDLEGRLIAETRPNGTLVRAYVYDDQAPIAQAQRNAADQTYTIVHVHTDHLGTPRSATDSARVTVWTHDPEAFGRGKPETDPDGDAANTNIRLRFPGQYHDGESGLYYNHHRYYDPRIGRYVSSDPIGLEGGLNTYMYVENRPLTSFDPNGLEVRIVGHMAASPLGRTTKPNSYHLALYLKPDNSCSCPGSWPVTVGGQLNLNNGKLYGVYNYPGDALSNATFSQVVPAPKGQTDCQFIKNVLKASYKYRNNLEYSFPAVSTLPFERDGYMAPGKYNSNSFVPGVLKASGTTPPPLNTGGQFQAPGYNNPIPLGR